jgi:hypothetical protein
MRLLLVGEAFWAFPFYRANNICIAKGLWGWGCADTKGVIHSILRYPRTALGLLLGAGFSLMFFFSFSLLWEVDRQASWALNT